MNSIQQIFRDHAPDYVNQFGHKMPERHSKVIRAICDCRSGDCGVHVYACPDCGEKHVANSSCGNRHCPVCQHEKGTEWVYKQQLRLLPANYFFATFTIPDSLRVAARKHPALVYAAMFKAASESLKTLSADPRFTGCKISGFTGVLHTWGRQIQYHPHIHFIIPGGGLNAGRDKWVSAKGHFLVHVKALSVMFRGKMNALFKKEGLFDLTPDDVWGKDWVIHCKFVGDGRHVVKYLGAYVFRVAISSARIVAYDGAQVTFKYQKVDSSKWKYMTLSVFEFMRRYLLHVLPTGFMKIRHYGFLSPNFSIPIQRLREIICVLYEVLRNQPVAKPPPTRYEQLKCPSCGTVMIWKKFIPMTYSSPT